MEGLPLVYVSPIEDNMNKKGIFGIDEDKIEVDQGRKTHEWEKNPRSRTDQENT